MFLEDISSFRCKNRIQIDHNDIYGQGNRSHPNAPIRRGQVKNNHPINRQKLSFSSDSYDDSEVIPIISTKQTTSSPEIPTMKSDDSNSESSDSNSSSYSSSKPNENSVRKENSKQSNSGKDKKKAKSKDWTPKGISEPTKIRPTPSAPSVHMSPKFKRRYGITKPKVINEEKIKEIEDKTQNEKQESLSSSLKKENEEKAIEETAEKEVHSKNYVETIEKRELRKVVETPVVENEKKPDENKDYIIMYESNTFKSLWKRSIRMILNENVVFVCRSANTQFGKTHIVCSKFPCEIDSPTFEGLIVRHQSGYRFTLLTRNENDEYFQSMGFAFLHNVKSDRTIRAFQLAIPAEGNPVPVTTEKNKENDLSRIALSSQPPNNVKIYRSVLPRIGNDGTYVINLGIKESIPSTKNFIIEDNSGKNVMKLYKASNRFMGIRVLGDLPPIVMYTISVAITTSSK
ncbi:hypothetical protein TRFO_23517 [Tritrichomonas foetus]|uniref:Uncharacterized protein n=1 Tax=Tritrichomonas foetus TaxID=1144522 RepID=A0A1J4KED6_9EUKA|nr:hypothetical protein TRFO_23517 [Tritrichomonas foetus]|eukprot:OHT08076.1 hypothetical protein TRFO_23517 [Tritrichomonas foetus]